MFLKEKTSFRSQPEVHAYVFISVGEISIMVIIWTLYRCSLYLKKEEGDKHLLSSYYVLNLALRDIDDVV